MKDKLEKQLAVLVAEHSSWLDSDAWLEACSVVCQGYFPESDADQLTVIRIPDFIEALKDG